VYDDLSVIQNLEFFGQLYSLRRAQVRERANELLELVELTDRAKERVGTLSGGMRRRVSLAISLLHKPRLAFLDEPTAGVDPKARREFWDKIHDLTAEGLTVLVSTHYMDEAERCHAIAYLAYGNLLAQGSVQGVVAQSGLTTWAVDGGVAAAKLTDLARKLSAEEGVEMVAPFGTMLHVSGIDRLGLEAAIAPYRTDSSLVWKEMAPTLEDVFIHLMGSQTDERLK
ncbi:MAG: ABC transporter ATP-binding protein, partial [Rhodospirillales bacterium]|nr:ABC transporter ATP-binding protein [Rhodospirillales bacterium]